MINSAEGTSIEIGISSRCCSSRQRNWLNLQVGDEFYISLVLAFAVANLIIAVIFGCGRGSDLSYTLVGVFALNISLLVIIYILGVSASTAARKVSVIALACSFFIGFSFFSGISVIHCLRLLLVLSVYSLIGYYPTKHWIRCDYGVTFFILLSAAWGALITSLVATSAFVIFGLEYGTLLTFALIIVMAFLGFRGFLSRMDRAKLGPWTVAMRKIDISKNEAQIFGIVFLVVTVNALFMELDFPIPHHEGVLRAMKAILTSGRYEITGELLGIVGKPVFRIGSLAVPIFWHNLIEVNIEAATYFEVLLGQIGLSLMIYFFARKIFVDKHVAGMACMITVMFLGELHIYAKLIPIVLSGESLAPFSEAIDKWSSFTIYCRSRLSPHFIPWSQEGTIDGLRGYFVVLFGLYALFKRDMDPSALLVLGFSVSVVLGAGYEELFYTFLITVTILMAWNLSYLRSLVKSMTWFFTGMALGIPVWIALSWASSSLMAVNERLIYFRSVQDWGLCISDPRGVIYLNLLQADTWKYVSAEWALPGILILGTRWVWMNPLWENLRRPTTLGFAIMWLVPLFLGSTLLLANWDLNRFCNPLLLWWYMYAGIGLVGVFSKTPARIRIPLLTLALVLMILPTLMLSYQRFLWGRQ